MLDDVTGFNDLDTNLQVAKSVATSNINAQQESSDITPFTQYYLGEDIDLSQISVYFQQMANELKLNQAEIPSDIEEDYNDLILSLEDLTDFFNEKQPVLFYLEQYSNAVSTAFNNSLYINQNDIDFLALDSSFENAIILLSTITPPAGMEELHAITLEDMQNYKDYMAKLNLVFESNANANCIFREEIDYNTATQAEINAYIESLDQASKNCTATTESLPTLPEMKLATYDYSNIQIVDENRLNSIIDRMNLAVDNINKYYKNK